MKPEITGILLAGGKSSRMGMDKGMVSFRGKPLSWYPFEVLKRHCTEVLISTGNPEYSLFDVPMVEDGYPGYGPMGGICSAMNGATNDWCLVLACDMPFVSHRLVESLLEAMPQKGCCVIPVHHGLKEPLAALYHRRIIPEMQTALEENRPSLYRLIQSTEALFLNAEPLLELSPELFANVNLQEDLDRLTAG